MLQQLLTYSFITSRVGYIESPLHKRDERAHREKAQLNIFLKAPFGFTKTSEMMYLVENNYAYICTEHTEAGLLGTVRGDMYFRGDIINGANRLFVIDEYYLVEDKARRHLLTIMSHGWARRAIQTFSKRRINERGEGWEVNGETSGFMLKIRTSLALSTAILEKKVDEVTEMLMSRCFNLNYYFSKEDAIEILLGEKPIETPKIKEVDYIEKVTLPESVAKDLAIMISRLEIVPEDYGGYYMRAYWDLVKIATALAILDDRTEIKKEDVEEAYRYYPLHSLGFLGNQLSKKEIQVYLACRCKSSKQISEETGIPLRTVQRILRELKEIGIIKEHELSLIHI